jgi:protocatechuate 3,4-dioxygenase beta subunit
MNDDDDAAHAGAVSRRRALGLLGAVGLGVVGAACSGDAFNRAAQDTTTSSGAPSTTGGSASGSSTTTRTAACVLTPEVTEGPYYLDLDKVRSDITEDRPGTPLELRITVLDATTCAPIKDAAVDVWHCDAAGAYSGFGNGARSSNDLAFLRGTQLSDADGVVTFRTIYPGWYPGRAVHIHTKVHAGGSVVHTGQLFFADAQTDTAYRAAPYDTRPTPNIRNAADSIYRQAGGSAAELDVKPDGSGYLGTIDIGVRRTSSTSSRS